MNKLVFVLLGKTGSGKSTIVQAFLTLKKTMGTMQVKDLLKDLQANKKFLPKINSSVFFHDNKLLFDIYTF